MQTIENQVVMDGHPDIAVARRTSIKLAERPKIVVAMPIGGKPVVDVFEDPQGNKYANQRGFRAQGMIPVQFMLNHMNWVPPLNVSMAYLVKTGMLSSHARQVMTMEAIRMNAEYVFYVDDDTLVPPLGLYTLYNFMEQNPHAGAVTGVYTTRETPNEPLIYQAHGEGAAWDFEMGPGAKPELCFGAGAGCLLARVSAIKDWMEKNPGVPIWADEKDIPSQNGESSVMWGHDVRFCRMLNMNNTPVYVHGQVLCGHYDIRSGQVFEVPNTAPGFQKTKDRLGNINTSDYWDQVYGQEGADTWRKYPRMFAMIADAVTDGVIDYGVGKRVLELGCGVGILGSKLTGERGVIWKGYDISPTAVDMCRTRFLNAEVLDIRQLEVEHLDSWDIVVMSETLEHLERNAGVAVLQKIEGSTAERLIITTPDDCMGPDEVPEHTALFNVNYVDSMLDDAGYDDEEWSRRYDKADDHHLICVVERK
jgi:2-polyprenyl-3-methyl-5-hydroxy-6-metoxy-1,4-benzoquinol methylase